MKNIRSILYYAILIISLILIAIFFWWILLLPKKYVRLFGGLWDGFAIWTLKVICGIKTEMRGKEYLDNKSVIYASKHQSALETFYLGYTVINSAFTLKKELYWIPVFGWFLARAGMVGIDRKAGRKSIQKMLKEARIVKEEGRPFLLFPEGTRRSVDAEPDYKTGVYILYKDLGLRVVPVAHNAGMFWKRGAFDKRAGTAVFEFLPHIEAGLSKDEFMHRLIDSIETKTNALVEEANENRNPK